jgi:5-methylcytosine-specific restriction endonuclease McrA
MSTRDATQEVFGENRRKALDYANQRCQRCGVGDIRLHVHHKKPRAEGGSDDLENLIVVCPECHAEAHDAEPCKLCGNVVHYGGTVSIQDNSGVSTTHLCNDCIDIVERSADRKLRRCGVCARTDPKHERSRKIYLQKKEGDVAETSAFLCDECRRRAFLSERRETEEYLAELPDPWVNFDHWQFKEFGGAD